MAALHGAAPTPFMLNYHMASTIAKSRSPSVGNSPAMHPGSTHGDAAGGITPLSLSPVLAKEPSSKTTSESPSAATSTSEAATAAADGVPTSANGRPFPEWQAPAPASRPAPPKPVAPTHFEPPARNSGPQWRSLRPDPARDRDRVGGGFGGGGGGSGRLEWWEELLCLEQLGCCAPRDDRRKAPKP
jgi:hypothetical protein